MTTENSSHSKRKNTNIGNNGGKTTCKYEKKKRKNSHIQGVDIGQSFKKTSFYSKKIKECMDIFVKENEHDHLNSIRLNPVEIKHLKDGFKYIGYRCRVVVSRQKTKEQMCNLPGAFNWVEGVIKYWDPKFKLFFIHFLLSPTIGPFQIQSSCSKKEWKYLVTQNNAPPASANQNDLVLSPYAIDRGWFDPNPITLKLYGESPVITNNIFSKDSQKNSINKTSLDTCSRCKTNLSLQDSYKSCFKCLRKFHLSCVTDISATIDDLKDPGIISLRKCHLPSNQELLCIANQHNKYIRERRRNNRNKSNFLINRTEGNIGFASKRFQENQLPYDLVDIKELERAIPVVVKNIILENCNSSHTSIRKLLLKLPNKLGSIIGDHQIKLLCRNYRYNKRNKLTLLSNIIEDEHSSIDTPLESSLSDNSKDTEYCIDDNHTSSEPKSIRNKVNDVHELARSDFVNIEDDPKESAENSKITYLCKECMVCMYCNEPLILGVPVLLKPNELPNRTVLYSHIPTKIENFVVCSTCGVCYHGSCANSFIPPLIFGGNHFNCHNCCQCIHCGYRDDGFMDYASWDSTFTSCLRCCKGFEKGQYCSICRKIWTSSWEGEWLQCDVCKFWVHYNCDKELNQPIEFYSITSHLYNCPVCRSNESYIKFQRILDLFICMDKNKDFNSIPLPSYQNYWKVVKIPMDIITINKNLKDNKYGSEDFSFIRDIFRIIYNAQISHMPNHRIFKLATNILKRVSQLFKLLFGEQTLLNFLKTIGESGDSMSILVDQLSLESPLIKEFVNESRFQKMDIYSSEDPQNKIQNLDCESNLVHEIDVILTDDTIYSARLNSNNKLKLNEPTSFSQLLPPPNEGYLNEFFKEIASDFQSCGVCEQRHGKLVHCIKCGFGVHFNCYENIDNPFICNSCTRCYICNEYMTERKIPVIRCSHCNKKVHYVCIWEEYDTSEHSSNTSRLTQIRKYNTGNCNPFASKNFKDIKDYKCIWRVYSCVASPNKSKVLISSPNTVVFGKGYYQYLISELYLCTECTENEIHKKSNIFMLEYTKKYNSFILEKAKRLQQILTEKLAKDDIKICLGFTKNDHKIMNLISEANLKHLDIIQQKNILFCSVCSSSFSCLEFDDLKEFKDEKELCLASINFLCSRCKHIHGKNMNMEASDNLKNIEPIDSRMSLRPENINLNDNVQTEIFPLILNTLISTSQFRITLSKDISLLLKLVLNSLESNILRISGNTLHRGEIYHVKSDLSKEFFRSESCSNSIRRIFGSSILHWYLFYIHMTGPFDFSHLRKNYLEYFYRSDINLDDLIKSNTISIIINSIEKMVLSNEFSPTVNNIKNLMSDSDFFTFLNLYSNFLIIHGSHHLFGSGNPNIFNCQAIIDTKMYLDIYSSFKENILLNQIIKRNTDTYLKPKILKKEITQGLTVIKNQIEKLNYIEESNNISIFTILYYFIFNEDKQIDFENKTTRCKYCLNEKNLSIGDYLIHIQENVFIHKECILWSLPFVLEPILNNIDMGYESRFETKKKSEIYSPMYPTFGKISWPIILNPIIINISDIIITLNDLSILKCFICDGKGATIKCSGNDACFKYFHLDCIFKSYMGNHKESNTNYIDVRYTKVNGEITLNPLIEYSVYIRIKYRRVWCQTCWEAYKRVIEPESNFTEGLTGGIINNFVKMLSMNIKINKNSEANEFRDKSPINETSKVLFSFLDQLIHLSGNIRNASKGRVLTRKLKFFRNKIPINDSKFNPCLLNNSLILLNPGLIYDDWASHKFADEPLLFPTNYKAIRIWKSSNIINKQFQIEDDISMYLCSINSSNGMKEFRIDWIPNSQSSIYKVCEVIRSDFHLNIDKLTIEITLYDRRFRMFVLPLLRSLNLNKLFKSFSEILEVESVEHLSNETIESLTHPEYLSMKVPTNLNVREVFNDDLDYKSQLFFGLREQYLHILLKRKVDQFSAYKLISNLYSNHLIAKMMHPKLWRSHRHYSFTNVISNHEEFEYSKLGRNETRGNYVSVESFNILFFENSNSEDAEIMSTLYQNNQEYTKRNKIKLEDMAPSKLYRYLDSLPYDKRLEIRKSNIHGFGLFAKEIIKPGEPIIEYIGELIRNSVADRREHFYRSDGNRDGSCYMFRLDDSSVIDATNIGNQARFMNHCCEPNSICKVITINPENKHIVIFSKKIINKDEEITYDYQFNVEEASEKIICRCGAINCLGRMN
ncbi:putative histone-lysine N-methyltransferase 1 [Cryptosporidium felis]|nr:putative histone-lysine N-methyltransferase 1 [Cryptosporidium felis]